MGKLARNNKREENTKYSKGGFMGKVAKAKEENDPEGIAEIITLHKGQGGVTSRGRKTKVSLTDLRHGPNWAPPRDPVSGRGGETRQVAKFFGAGSDPDFPWPGWRDYLLRPVPSCDAKTFKDGRVTIVLPAKLLEVMENMIQAGIFPEITSRSVLGRMAIAFFMEMLQHVDSRVKGVHQAMAQVDGVLHKDSTIREGVSSQLRALRECFQAHTAEGRPEFGVRAIYQCAQLVREMPEGPWREEYLRRLEDEFGAQIKRADREASRCAGAKVAKIAKEEVKGQFGKGGKWAIRLRKGVDQTLDPGVEYRSSRSGKGTGAEDGFGEGDSGTVRVGSMVASLEHWAAIMGEEFVSLEGNNVEL